MLGAMKRDLHDRLWNAQQRWFALRAEGDTKRELKLRGIRECGDPNRYTRGLIFAGSTRITYERMLKGFVEFAHREHGCRSLADIDERVVRDFMDRAIAQGLAAKTLHVYRSALAKLGALTGRSASAAAQSVKYGRVIRELVRADVLRGPSRATPSPDMARRTVEILREWDGRHHARTDEERAYHLAARLQLETSCRSISATTRVSAESLRPNNQIVLIGKGGRSMTFTLSAELHGLLSLYLRANPGPLAHQRGYQAAYARAARAAGGQVTGTHGLRRLSTQEFYRRSYRAAVGSGMATGDAAAAAKGDAVQRLGHSRHRTDVARCYFGKS
jgi:hypothetical protein